MFSSLCRMSSCSRARSCICSAITGTGKKEIQVDGGVNCLAPRPAHHLHELGDLAPLVGLVAALDGVINAMRDVIAQNLLLDPA